MNSATKKEFFQEKFGDRRYDPYHWMREKDSPEVLEYLKAENKYAQDEFKKIEALKESIFQEIKKRIPGKYDSCPYKEKDYFYWESFIDGKEYPVLKRKHIKTNKEQVLIDINKLAEGKKYYDVGSTEISPNQSILAYSVDEAGNESYDVYFKNLETEEEVGKTLLQIVDNFVWAADNKTIFYTQKDKKTLRSYQIFRYDIYTGKKKLIYEEKDDTYNVSVSKTSSDDYIVISATSSQTTENYFISASKPYEKPTLFLKRKKKHEYYIDHGESDFYILTNKDGAKNFKLMKTPVNSTDDSEWEDVIPYDENIYTEDFQMFKNAIALEVRRDGYAGVQIFDRKTKSIHQIDFPDSISTSFIGTNGDYDVENIRVATSSPLRPYTIYDYDYKNRKLEFKRQFPVGGGFSSDDYTVKREVFTARDGAEVPVSLFYKKDLKITKDTPVYLGGYGSYGISYNPSFSIDILSLVDRGFIYAIAHIRGGADKGVTWYEEGKLLKKKNTFYDFIDAAEHLIKNNYTSPSHLYIQGRSAGGLLMGAVLNMRPDLFNGAIAGVPFVDAVTTMLDDSIPLTTGEYEEWGNPNEKEYYDYMKSYSPYDNVKKTSYPHILILSGYNDPRVQYWEPSKWAARLREYKTDNNKLFLVTEMGSGHFGDTGRFEYYKLKSLELAFLLSLEGIKE